MSCSGSWSLCSTTKESEEVSSFLPERLPSLSLFLFHIKNKQDSCPYLLQNDLKAQALQCCTHARIPSPQMHGCPTTWPDTDIFLSDSENSQHPTQLAGLFPCCHCKGLPERGKKQTTTGWLVLDLHIHLAESWPVSYNPPAEGGGNAQWYPVITEPKMEIN